jgi:hypothetical protein
MNNQQIQINNNAYDSCLDIDQSHYDVNKSYSIDGFINDNFQYDSPYKITFVRGSNSPITTSNNSDNNSDSDNDNSDNENTDNRNAIKRYKINIDTDIDDDDIVLPDATHISEINIHEDNERIHKSPDISSSSFAFRKLTYKEIEKSLEQYNIDDSFKYSNELEILITYLKGQKNLYIQSKNLTQFKLNLLTIPAILIASGITIIAPFISHHQWSGAIVSGINATITLLISFLSYFKLESCHQMFSHLANQYDKLETSLEITNSKLMFMENQMEQNQLIMSKIREFEEKIFEIKESCVSFIPEELKPLFPIICHLNVFSFIKKIESYKKTLIIKYRDVKNEMRYILCKSQERIYNSNMNNMNNINNSGVKTSPNSSSVDIQREKDRLLYLTNMKSKLIEEIIQYKNAYSHIDNAFIEEIQNAENKKIGLIMILFGVRPRVVNNPLIQKYLTN